MIFSCVCLILLSVSAFASPADEDFAEPAPFLPAEIVGRPEKPLDEIEPVTESDSREEAAETSKEKEPSQTEKPKGKSSKESSEKDNGNEGAAGIVGLDTTSEETDPEVGRESSAASREGVKEQNDRRVDDKSRNKNGSHGENVENGEETTVSESAEETPEKSRSASKEKSTQAPQDHEGEPSKYALDDEKSDEEKSPEVSTPAAGISVPVAISNFRRALYYTLGYPPPFVAGSGNAAALPFGAFGNGRPKRPKPTPKPNKPKPTGKPNEAANVGNGQPRPPRPPRPPSGDGKDKLPDKTPPVHSGDYHGCNLNQQRPVGEGSQINSGHPPPPNNFGPGWAPGGWYKPDAVRPSYPRPNNGKPPNNIPPSANGYWNGQYAGPDYEYGWVWQGPLPERPHSASSEEHDGGISASDEARGPVDPF